MVFAGDSTGEEIKGRWMGSRLAQPNCCGLVLGPGGPYHTMGVCVLTRNPGTREHTYIIYDVYTLKHICLEGVGLADGGDQLGTSAP